MELARQGCAQRGLACSSQPDQGDAFAPSGLVDPAKMCHQQVPRLKQFGRGQATQKLCGMYKIDRWLGPVECQGFQRKIKRFGDVAQQQDGDVALTAFELGEVAFRNAGVAREDFSGHAAAGAGLTDPVAEYPEEAVVVAILGAVITFVITVRMAHRSVRRTGHRRHDIAVCGDSTCIILPQPDNLSVREQV